METKSETIEHTITSRMDLVKDIELNRLYSVSFTESRATLQGNLSKTNRYYFEELGFEFKLTEHTWIEADKDEIKVVLTFN